MGSITPLRQVNLGNDHREHHEHDHSHSQMGPRDQLLALIQGVAQDLDAYNHQVAKITHQEHLLNK